MGISGGTSTSESRTGAARPLEFYAPDRRLVCNRDAGSRGALATLGAEGLGSGIIRQMTLGKADNVEILMLRALLYSQL